METLTSFLIFDWERDKPTRGNNRSFSAGKILGWDVYHNIPTSFSRSSPNRTSYLRTIFRRTLVGALNVEFFND